jgi:superfamily II DNA or RNA helicase
MNYYDFLQSKDWAIQCDPVKTTKPIHESLFGYQKESVKRLLEMGRGAAFLDTGLGKTVIQCEWARHIDGRVLFVAPLAVAQQTKAEALKLLGMELDHCKDGSSTAQYVITNYERLDNFNAEDFKAVVLDESSILKSFMGKTKQSLCEKFANTPYRLACTATPAPNDYMELGNHSEFLGIMPGTEMLTRWFINDAASVGVYRLKGHAISDFWKWVASWSVVASKPSDLGFDDSGFTLPKLNSHTVPIESDLEMEMGDGMLFDLPVANAANLHRERRKTIDKRVSVIADMVNNSTEPWVIWCESNDESEALARAIPDCVEVKGSDSADNKESRLIAFSEGSARVIVSKPSICGFGMNWQHCRKMVFCAVSYSFEKYYQAVRRCYRFGQKREVDVYVLLSDSEMPVWKAVLDKADRHEGMKRDAVMSEGESKRGERVEYREVKFHFPEWLVSKSE